MTRITLIRAPIVIGSLISGTLVLVSLLAILMSNPRWDDYLLNAIGVFVGALFISLTLRLATAAFLPQPGLPRRVRFINIVWFIALVLLIVIAIAIAVFINNFSFL